jgi:ABC-type dipeptide/oligopeptide/nickel transport system ATPase component
MSLMHLLPRRSARIEGRMLLRGRDIGALPEREMNDVRGKQMAMIFQEPMTSLNPLLTIGYQLREPMRYHLGLGREATQRRAIELLEMVGIPAAEQIMRGYPHQLSGGMRQRVMIAIALSCDPDLLIADEPTTALDVTIQSQIIELLRQIQRRTGMSVIIITHDLGVVSEFADEVIVMYAGRIVESGRSTKCWRARGTLTRAACSRASPISTTRASDSRPFPETCRTRFPRYPAAGFIHAACARPSNANRPFRASRRSTRQAAGGSLASIHIFRRGSSEMADPGPLVESARRSQEEFSRRGRMPGAESKGVGQGGGGGGGPGRAVSFDIYRGETLALVASPVWQVDARAAAFGRRIEATAGMAIFRSTGRDLTSLGRRNAATRRAAGLSTDFPGPTRQAAFQSADACEFKLRLRRRALMIMVQGLPLSERTEVLSLLPERRHRPQPGRSLPPRVSPAGSASDIGIARALVAPYPKFVVVWRRAGFVGAPLSPIQGQVRQPADGPASGTSGPDLIYLSRTICVSSGPCRPGWPVMYIAA